MKRFLMLGAVAVLVAAGFMTTPATAEEVSRVNTCTMGDGSNSLTYDCNFNVKGYTLGSPITVTATWSCTGTCSMASFGLRGGGFSPNGVSGHMVSAKKFGDGVSMTFAFDSLKSTGNGGTGNAHFKMGIKMDDGAGNVTVKDCPIEIHLNQ